MKIINYLHKLICPECSNNINESNYKIFNEENGFIFCDRCSIPYFIDKQILRLLNNNLNDKKGEKDFINKYKNELGEFGSNKLKLLKQNIVADENNEWRNYEKNFWDTKKYSTNELKISNYNYNRFEPRKRHITKYLEANIENKLVVEFGSGSSSTLYHIMNPKDFKYELVCTDISYNALLKAQKHHPNSAMIQCDACNPPFLDESIDIVLNFGTFHHLPNNIEVLRKQISIIKEDGYLGFHEPLDRRAPFLSHKNILKRIFFNKLNEESEHNEFIKESIFLKTIKENGEIINSYYEYSPTRSMMASIVFGYFNINNIFVYNIIKFIDQATIKTLGRVFNSFDSNAILLLWQKKK